MADVVLWCGFLGAWLLVAGPVYQAALELREQDNLQGEIEKTFRSLPAPAPVSAWWWLLPPVRYLMERRRWKRQRETAMSVLTPAQRRVLVGYINKSTGWLLVGFSGFLIAVKETWDVCERYEWPFWVFVLLAVAAAVVCLSFTAARMGQTDRLLAGETEDAEPLASA